MLTPPGPAWTTRPSMDVERPSHVTAMGVPTAPSTGVDRLGVCDELLAVAGLEPGADGAGSPVQEAAKMATSARRTDGLPIIVLFMPLDGSA